MDKNSMKYSFIYSPRTNYINKREKENKLFIELAKSFDPYTIKILKKHFKEHLGILNKENFICIIKNHLLSWEPDIPHREKIIIKLLSRLFEEIDINSKGEIEWKDFVSYIILLSNISANENSLYSLQNYNPSKTVINHKSINTEKNSKYKFISEPDVISFCLYIKKYKFLAIVHEGKSNIIFYNMDRKKVEPFEIDIMETQKEITKFEINELNMKAEKMIKKEEEEKNKKLGIFQSKLSIKITQQNSKETDKNKDKDTTQRMPTPENVKNEIAKINKIKVYSSLDNITKKNKFENYYPISICFADEYDIMFISSSNNKISSWKFDNKKYEFININYPKNLNTNPEIRNIQIPLLSCDMPQYAMCFDPEYKVLYTGEEDGKVYKWDLVSSKPVHTFEIISEEKNVYDQINIANANKHKKIIEILSLSKVDRALLMKKNKKENKGQAIKDNKKEKNAINFKVNQEQKKKTVSCLILINNLKLLCSAYYTGQIVLWDIINKQPKKIFKDQKTIINQIIYNPIINRIYTCGFEHEIYVYDPYNGEKAMKKLIGHNSSISSISFNKETNELVSIDNQGIMKLWDCNNNFNFQSINIKEILNLEDIKQQKNNKRDNILANSNFSVNMLSNTKQIILYGKHNIILFEKGKMVNPHLCDDNIIIGCKFNPYNNNIMTVSTKAIKFWNIFNGKMDKIYENLMDNEIAIFELDKRNKKCYLGDNYGKIKCYNLINGVMMKEFKSHNAGIVNIIHSLKNNGILYTGSSDLYIRIHSNIDDKEDAYKEMNILNNSIDLIQEKKILKKFLYNETDNMLIMALSNGYISYYDLNYNKFINDIFKKHEKNAKRPSTLSCILDISNTKSLFLAHENGEKYIFTKANNKHYHYLTGEKLGIFSEDDNIKGKNIIYSSFYDEKSKRLLIGDHNGFITAYDMNILIELMDKNYNSKEDIINDFRKNLIFKKILQIQFSHNGITHLSLPENLFPKIFIAISSDSVANIYDFEKGEYIESLKQISMKNTSVPIAISYLKQNPFNEPLENEDKNKKLEGDDNILLNLDEESNNRKEKILQTIQKINITKKTNLNKDEYSVDDYSINQNNMPKEGIIYRRDIEEFVKSPKLDFENAKRSNIINYSNDLVIYNAKIKLLSQVKGQKVPDDKSSPWNYDINLEYIQRKEKEERRKLYNKITENENNIKISEYNFQHTSLINTNYIPTFLTNLKNENKNSFDGFVKEKLRVIDLTNMKKSIINKEEKQITKYIQNHKFPNKKIKSLTIDKTEMEQKELNKKKFKLKLREELDELKDKNINKILNKRLFIKGINKTEEKLGFDTINNAYNYHSNVNIFNNREKKISLNQSPKMISFTKRDFNDIRFLHCKNEFDEKINEMASPLKLMMLKNKKIFKLPKLNTNY